MSERDDDTATWAFGLTFAAFVAVAVGVVVVAVGTGLLLIHPLLAVVLNVLVAMGFAQPLWSWRKRPTWRFIALGVAVGAAGGWIALLFRLLTGAQ